MSYRRGEDTDEAMVGALLEAQAMADLRLLGGFVRGLARGAKRG